MMFFSAVTTQLEKKFKLQDNPTSVFQEIAKSQ